MGHIEATQHLPAAPAVVWSVISDPNTWGSWFGVHDKWLEGPPAEFVAGDRLVAKVVMLGMANKIEWTVIEVETPTTLALSGLGMAGVKCSFRFQVTPDEGGAKVSVSGDFEGALIKGALGKAVEKDGIKQLATSLEKLEALAVANA